ncbi:MAG: bifunctional phosphoribosylaminoimidazolecarboxamide formyltransferase/IMP cyclohydrolase [Actinomycetes bacterium]
MRSPKLIRRALVSVYDKTGLIELGTALHAAGVEILSTGSTAKALAAAQIPVIPVEDYTGFPEMMGGRVKTLHPRIHAGILADQNNPEHLAAILNEDIKPFDLIVINLYPFAKTIAHTENFAECIEQIDIGGPSMLRGAAKNHGSVAVISDPSQYARLFEALANGGFTLEERTVLAMETFRRTAEYDIAIATWLGERTSTSDEWTARVWERIAGLRYGENPHQSANVYRDTGLIPKGIASAKQLHGKEMSFNNYTDADAALRAAFDHEQPCVAIIKHANPCGIAIASDIATAHAKAHECDPLSAFGGVVAANRIVTAAMALKLSEIFTEVVIAPAFEEAALEILMKKPSIRILTIDNFETPNRELRPISGGVLIQESDLVDAEGDISTNWKQVSGAAVSSETLIDLEFAWRSVRAVKSNAILLAYGGASVGVGMGQVNRVDSARLAVSRAGDRANGSVAASDAFFPFADGLQILIDAGITAVVQPGGSVRDEEVIAAATSAGIAMFFTGTRHFSHA